jgi:hypothetical protein
MFPVACFPKSNTRSSAGPAYVRTAFVSSAGDDGTAALNDDTLPYLTQDAAVAALATAYAGQPTILCYKTNTPTDLSLSADLNTLLTAGLTMQAATGTVTLSGAISFGSAPDALLTLVGVVITSSLVKAAHTGATVESAGTITGDANSSIAQLNLSVAGAANGANGADSWTVTGSDGFTGWSGDPPSAGTSGNLGDASGGNGLVGDAGARAWNVTLVGVGSPVLAFIVGMGGNGGTGGDGGTGGSATGGNGGIGGSSTNMTDPQDGAAGGDGGEALANGGAGADGGAGGDGSIVTNTGWSITSSILTGGTGGAFGVGAAAGTATAGNGGAGGAGANGGANGADGNTGPTSAVAGSDGTAGAAGADGYIL